MATIKFRTLNSSEDHAKYQFDAGDGKMEVFINRTAPPKTTEGLDTLRIFEMAIGPVSGQETYDVEANMKVVAAVLKKFLIRKPDMVLFHTAARPGETADALTTNIKETSLGGYATYRHVTAGMTTFAFVRLKSDIDSLSAFLSASHNLTISLDKKSRV